MCPNIIDLRFLTEDRLASVCFRTASRELENGFVRYHGQPKRHSETDRQERSRAQEFAAGEAWCSRERPRMSGPVLPRIRCHEKSTAADSSTAGTRPAEGQVH